jgi:hypothetical protein
VSDSSTATYTCMRVKSCATVETLGPCRAAATDCSTSMFRATMVPSIIWKRLPSTDTERSTRGVYLQLE